MKRCHTAKVPSTWFSHLRLVLPGLTTPVMMTLSAITLAPSTLLAQSSGASAGAQAYAAPAPQRTFPAKARRGELTVINAHEVTIDGRTMRLSPGSTIRSTSNALVVTGPLIGQTFNVNYTTDTMGQAHEIWILSPVEMARKPAGHTHTPPASAPGGGQ